jgi:hypothetical protein
MWLLLDGVSLYPIQPLWDIYANQPTNGFLNPNVNPAALYSDKNFFGGNEPIIQSYFNGAGVPFGQVNGAILNPGPVYPVAGWWDLTGSVIGASYETSVVRDVFANMMPSENAIYLFQDSATCAPSGCPTSMGVPSGPWTWVYSPGAATMGWQNVDVFATASNSPPGCPTPTSCSVFHLGRNTSGWASAWDELPSPPTYGVGSGVGAVLAITENVSISQCGPCQPNNVDTNHEYVAIVDTQNELEILETTPATSPSLTYSSWTPVGKPPAGCSGSPALSALSTISNQMSAWVVDNSGQLWECQLNLSLPPPWGAIWINHGAPRTPTGTTDWLAPNPTAVSFGDQNLEVHALSLTGNSYAGGFECNWSFEWYTGKPGEVQVDLCR